MSTRCMVGRSSLGKGRYVHCNGQPGWTGCALVQIIDRDGVEKAMTTIVDEHRGWSILCPVAADPNGSGAVVDSLYRRDAQCLGVPLYGYAFREQRDEWWPVGDSLLDYSYLVDDDGTIHVYAGKQELGALNAFDDDAFEAMQELR
ncbi:hypothetical protein QJ043_04130 [Olsenella sp. YH-ols2217]|uniref:Redoxin domain-containing protein n=1 Tax=Kribbibacterium absianum TaxID=3044210 RepID=A0ABT6ZKT2_9ACTN|nr:MULTISPECIES: hypothetical protein [unclassified Olsenella]MDJ1122751.1 hypothetical protein [Olsenella sp. YH-ols2216]MDJ1129266.1 hypothetical protein [Olsenella sp. YH-ols2217]